MGGTQVLRMVNAFTKTIVRVIIIIVDIIFLVLLGLALLKPRTGKIGKVQIILASIVILIVFGTSLTFLLSDKAMAKVFGSETKIPNPGLYCRIGTELYNQFFELHQQHASKPVLERVGLSAIDTLSWCQYASLSEVMAREAERKIEEIQAVLYPPPPPSQGSQGSGFYLDWFSKYNLRKYTIYYDLVKTNRIRINKPMPTPKDYRLKIIQRFSATRIELPENIIRSVQPIGH
jgi:hypothetical protein